MQKKKKSEQKVYSEGIHRIILDNERDRICINYLKEQDVVTHFLVTLILVIFIQFLPKETALRVIFYGNLMFYFFIKFDKTCTKIII